MDPKISNKIVSDIDQIIDLPLDHFHSSATFVMILNQNIPLETKNWLIATLKNNHLFVSTVSNSQHSDLTLLISCPDKILQENAKNVYQQLKRQTFDDKSSNEQLNTAEKQRILFNMIQKISSPHRTTMVGLPNVTLYSGQSIVEICCYEKIILHYFPLHDYVHLEKLRLKYCEYFAKDVDYVRNYFGEMIGFYFAFLNHYRNMFCITLIIYLICCLLQIPNELYTLILCFGVFIFIKIWKRHSNELAFNWGTIDLFELEKARPAFRSKGMHLDPITEQLAPYYPITKTWCKEYFLSIPLVIICLVLSFKIMCIYFEIEDLMATYYNENPNFLTFCLCFIPGILYAFIVMIFNHLYIAAFTKLNNYENHKTQESHENHLIVKLVLFEFFNNFISLFYIAFYLQDIEMLKYNLITMLTVNKIVENFIELFIPIYLVYRKNPEIFQKANSWKQQLLNEKILFHYEHTYYDCLELFIQFCYAFLFVAVLPWAPIVACINSILEIRMDAIKLCYCKRRPFQISMKSINNAWIKLFEVLSIVITISNLMVLGIVSDNFKSLSLYYNLSIFELIVYVEHIFLMLVLVFLYIVPDISKDLHLKMVRRKYLQISGIEKKKN